MSKRAEPLSRDMLSSDCVLFRGLSGVELERVAAIGQLQEIEGHCYLFHQHTPSQRVYNLISGAAMVERTSSGGQRQILAFLFPGDFVGMTHSDHLEYSVRSLRLTRLCEFRQQRLLALAEELPILKTNVKQVGANILARALDQIYILGKKKAHERLCFLFMQLLERLPGASPARIDLPMSRQDIADYLGLTIETVSRSLARLKQEGLIAAPSPQRLQIVDLEHTRALASAD
ncbi:cyclic nucleotide-binding domain-containing protein [Exilibacterium tricleocarpae]|uniref:Cyclic nucleotide-binding domain-containing protein n=1 Tax=Exilibacterium tricleocarpae TaxID=2591008 RepID=A0A545TVK4_9GAMM|nr:helix-turn-helix domain-containing protein [Exilibacterium tricleocarpae]TQV81257.1 cyclic nucleotide-binding domain-containing protein [Exilibacterium tricleocarpae]